MTFDSLGIFETSSFSGALKAINEIKKISGIKLIDKQILGDGIVTVFVKGDLGAIRKSLKCGADVLSDSNEFRNYHIIPLPHKDLLSKLNLERSN